MIDPLFEAAEGFSEGRAAVAVHLDEYSFRTWGYIDRDGRFVIPPIFERAEPFFEGRALVRHEQQDLFIDEQGRFLVTPPLGTYRSRSRFSGGLAAVMIDGAWGFIDRQGRIAIEPRFESAEPFSEGLAAVRLRGHHSPTHRSPIHQSTVIPTHLTRAARPVFPDTGSLSGLSAGSGHSSRATR